MKVYVTKYALSTGIEEVHAEVSENYPTLLHLSSFHYAHAGEWFTSRDEAIADAESRRVRKIASLKRQIAKLEGLRFDVVGSQP